MLAVFLLIKLSLLGKQKISDFIHNTDVQLVRFASRVFFHCMHLKSWKYGRDKEIALKFGQKMP